MSKGLLGLIAIAGAIFVAYYYRAKKGSGFAKSICMGCLSYVVLMLIGAVIAYSTMSDKERAEMDTEDATEKSIHAGVKDATNMDSVTWDIQTSIDEMTDTKNILASIRSINHINQGFPYEGNSYAIITIRYMKKYGYDVLVQISKGQIHGSSYSGTDYITARFDEGPLRNINLMKQQMEVLK